MSLKEAWPESRRRPSGKLAKLLHHGGQLAAVEVCIASFAGWEELIMKESAAAPPNTEHDLLLEAGRFCRGTFSPRVCSGSLRRSISHRRSPGDREKTSCSPSLGMFLPLQRVVLRSGGGKVMGDPNRPLVDEAHRPEPLGNCRKSAAQFLGISRVVINGLERTN